MKAVASKKTRVAKKKATRVDGNNVFVRASTYDLALDACNIARKANGRRETSKIKSGISGNSQECPIARTVGFGVGGGCEFREYEGVTKAHMKAIDKIITAVDSHPEGDAKMKVVRGING